MNPLDLTGPEFLRFYLAWGLGGLLLAAWLRSSWLNRVEAQVEARPWIPGYYPQDSEAYAVAFLRGGPREAARTLLARLVAGDFAVVANRQVQKMPAGGASPTLLPIERRALAALGGSQSPAEALSSIQIAVEPELREMENNLARQGLTLSAEQKKSLRNLQILALLLIAGLGVTKLAVALARGKTNVGYLLVLLALYTLAIVFFLRTPRIAPAGQAYLDWLRESHDELAQRTTSGKTHEVSDLVLAAGIFGPPVIPFLARLDNPPPEAKRRQPEGSSGCGSGATGGDSGGSDSGGSDSGGSDSGGSDGGGSSGCGGGGGCGGGCGGCGGG